VLSADFTFTTTNAAALNSLALTGSSAYAEAATATKLNLTGDWTVETWFKDETPGGYNHDTKYLAIKGDTNVGGEAPYLIGIQWNTLFAGERTGWTNNTLTSSLASVSAGTWHHVAAVLVASSRQLTIYLDGVQVAQGTLAALSTSPNGLPLEIGRNGSTGQFWQGKLDDLRIWNLARTAANISTSYQSELGTAPAGLVGNWKFNEGAGTLTADATPTPDNATLFGGAAFSPDIHP
jgi:hypothetical protein